MTRYLIDADAFLGLRGLTVPDGGSLLDLVAASPARTEPLVLTQYIARHELNSVAALVAALEAARSLVVAAVQAGDTAFKTYQALKRETHKGEAEALAWAIHQDPKPLFVSRDSQALAVATRHRVPRTDVMGFVVECVETGMLEREAAAAALTPWADPEQQLCRPRDWDGFAATYERRLGRPQYY